MPITYRSTLPNLRRDVCLLVSDDDIDGILVSRIVGKRLGPIGMRQDLPSKSLEARGRVVCKVPGAQLALRKDYCPVIDNISDSCKVEAGT